MHMSDALLSVAVGGTMTAVSTGAIGYSLNKMKRIEQEENSIPMMGVMGAFVFAAQMINFTIPVTGSSGHIGGGILLAALLGPYPAVITLASVLLIQCLFFADGGLLALGCNIFNMAVIPCLIIYPFIYKPMLKKAITPRRITIASILSVVIGLQLGAFSVVMETLLSGITELPFTAFVALMQPIHLAIGLIEGVVTAAVLCFIYRIRRDILEQALGIGNQERTSRRKIYVIFALAALLIGGVFSVFASSNPDGLEWSIGKIAGEEEIVTTSKLHSLVQNIEEHTAFFPDYEWKGKERSNQQEGATVNLTGMIGGLILLAGAALAGFSVMGYKKLRQATDKAAEQSYNNKKES